MKREVISQILDSLFEIRTMIFNEGDIEGLLWLHAGLDTICADLAVMKAAWLAQPDQEPAESDILEVEQDKTE